MAISKATILSADEITAFYEDMWPGYRYQALVTDHVILNGGIYDKSSSLPSKRFGSYWTKSTNSDSKIVTVSMDGSINSSFQLTETIDSQSQDIQEDSSMGIRPAFYYDFAGDIQELIPNSKNRYPDFLETTYGNYAQNVASRDMQEVLNKAKKNGKLKIFKNEFHTFFENNLRTFDIYEYDNQLYILEEVYVQPKDPNSLPCGTFYLDRELYREMMKGSVVLSNGVSYKSGDQVWVKIEPVKVFINLKKKIILADKILSTGCSFLEKTSDLIEYNNSNYGKTKLNSFLTNYFDKNLLQIGSSRMDTHDSAIDTNSVITNLAPTNYFIHEAGLFQIKNEKCNTTCSKNENTLGMTDEKFSKLIGEKSANDFEAIMALVKKYRQS